MRNGIFNIPLSELKFYPEEGTEISVIINFEYLSEYIAGGGIKSAVLTVGYEGGELEPVITIERVNEYDLVATIHEAESKTYDIESLTLRYQHDGDVVNHVLEKTDVGYIVAAPLNIDYTLFAYIEDSTQVAT